MTLPTDSHVHTEWSWDSPNGAMQATCARAAELGLPALAFTDHMDFDPWQVEEGELDGVEHLKTFLTEDNSAVAPPLMDADGYLECVERCRGQFPGLRIITGAELGEVHRNEAAAKQLLSKGRFERVIGSVHSAEVEGKFYEPPGLFRMWEPAVVMRKYLAEIRRMIEQSDLFSVLTHIGYATRTWPEDTGPFLPAAFEDDFRHTLRVLADTGRALEVNTAGRLDVEILHWWREEGGTTLTFGSDTHAPPTLARRFGEATAMAAEAGYRPGAASFDFWTVSTVR